MVVLIFNAGLQDAQQELSCSKRNSAPQRQSSENPKAQLPWGKIRLCFAYWSHRETHIKADCCINLTRTVNILLILFRQLDVHLLEKMRLNCQVFKEEISVVHLNRQVAHLQNALQEADVKVLRNEFARLTPPCVIWRSARLKQQVDVKHSRAGMWESCTDWVIQRLDS